MCGYVVEGFAEGLTLVICRLWIGHKLHLHTAQLKYYLLAAKAFAKTSKRHYLQQFLALVRHLAKAVDKTLAVGVELGIVLNVVKLAVEQHSLRRTCT